MNGHEPKRVSGFSRVLRYFRLGVSLILFVVGTVSLGYYGIEVLNARYHQAELSRQFDEALRNAPSHNKRDGQSDAHITPAAISEAGGATTKTVVPAAKNIPVGRIEINSVGIMAMIEEGTANSTLQQAVGHIQGTVLPGQEGNAGIAGHRDTFFRNLRNIHKDDEITVTTLAGKFRYRVDLISIVEPDDVSVLSESQQPILTLVTCYPFSYVGFAPKRFIVRANLVEAFAQ
jgi:sortase A